MHLCSLKYSNIHALNWWAKANSCIKCPWPQCVLICSVTLQWQMVLAMVVWMFSFSRWQEQYSISGRCLSFDICFFFFYELVRHGQYFQYRCHWIRRVANWHHREPYCFEVQWGSCIHLLFLTHGSFSWPWVYQDTTPSKVKERLYIQAKRCGT